MIRNDYIQKMMEVMLDIGLLAIKESFFKMSYLEMFVSPNNNRDASFKSRLQQTNLFITSKELYAIQEHTLG